MQQFDHGIDLFRISDHLNDHAVRSDVDDRRAEGFNYTHNFRTFRRFGFHFDQS
ncbi:hypothetical protein D3C73_1645540 [compost metagenome]